MTELKLQRLFEPAQIGQMRLKNRLVCPPMARNYASADGFVTRQALDHYERIARGGAGLIIVEATCIESPRGRGFDYQLVLDEDRFIPGFSQLAEVIHRHGAKAAVQLHHSGHMTRLDITHMQGVSPTPAHWPRHDPSRELTREEIQEIVVKFANAAFRAKKAGMDAVELHGAHFYLLSQFLSPAVNKRKDEYGGTLKNRARFLLQVLESVRKSVGEDFPVWCRINGQEYGIENGLTISEAQAVAVMLEKAGADAVHVSGGGTGSYAGYTSAIMYDPPAHFVHLAEAVKKVVNIPVIAVGKLNLQLAEDVLRKGKADFVAFGRSLLADPDLPVKASEGRFEDIRPCLWCRTCGDVYLYMKRSGIRCQVNAALGHEREYELRPAEVKKKVLIIGGGPAGMEAARVAALRGHEVTVYEKEPQLGGQMVLAAIPPHKTSIKEFTDYLGNQLNKLGVRINTGVEVTPALIKELKPDAVIMATGSKPASPQIPGIESAGVVTAEDILRVRVQAGEKVAIIGGGMVGCEVADYLSEAGRKVTVVEMLPEAAIGMGNSMRTRLLGRLASKGVTILTNAKCKKVTEQGLIYLDNEGQTRTVEADTIVLAAGSKPNRELFYSIGNMIPETYLIGDCVEPQRILEAVADGFRVGRMI